MSQPKSNEGYKETAEKYVREQLPELAFDGMMRCDGCEISYNSLAYDHSNCGSVQKVLNEPKPIQLQHWLKFLVPNHRFSVNGLGACFEEVSFNPTNRNQVWKEFRFTFNLTTGQPATELDYRNLCDILGI